MADTEPQTATGKVLWHFTMSLDGFVAGPNHSMDWMTGFSFTRPGLVEEYTETTGAVLGGRDGFDSYPDVGSVYGGAWQGEVFVLTHHPEDAQPAAGVTFLSCDVAEALQVALDAAGGKNVEVFSPTIGRQLLERGLIDEIDLHIAPVLLGDGIRLFDNPGGVPLRLELINGDAPLDHRGERSIPGCRSLGAATPHSARRPAAGHRPAGGIPDDGGGFRRCRLGAGCRCRVGRTPAPLRPVVPRLVRARGRGSRRPAARQPRWFRPPIRRPASH